MQPELTTSEINTLRKLQCNLVENSDYASVTCMLMLAMGKLSFFCSRVHGHRFCNGIPLPVCLYPRRCRCLIENHNKGYWVLDSHQQAALYRELCEHVYTDFKSVVRWIKETFGVEYTAQGIVDLLNRLGFTYKKTTEVPYEVDVCRQQEFVEELADNTVRNGGGCSGLLFKRHPSDAWYPFYYMPGFRKVNAWNSQPPSECDHVNITA